MNEKKEEREREREKEMRESIQREGGERGGVTVETNKTWVSKLA